MSFKEIRCAASNEVLLLATEPSGFLGRAIGLLGRKAISADEGMLFRDCRAIHMFAMRFSIDAVFIGPEGQVVKVVRDLRPWRWAGVRQARHVLEVAANCAEEMGFYEGRRVKI